MKNSFPNSLFKMALLCGVITASAGAGQFAQYYYSVGDLRAVSLAEGAGDDLGRQSAVKAFTQECLIGKKPAGNSIEESMASPSIGVMECAESNGFVELASVVVSADDALKSHAWPLSLVAGQNQ